MPGTGHRAHRFGASSETAEQLQLALETSEIAAAAMTARMKLPAIEEKDKPKRRLIPDHIPRMEVELSPGADACADCGGRLRRIGEDVTEELEYVPGRFIVNRIVRPRLTCSCCERFVQAPLPSRPIERGRPGPGLLAHVLVSKYADHLPLYRQSQIFDREGIDLDRSTLADWVGKSTALLEPLADAIGRHVLSAEAIFADDTPISMLAQIAEKTARITERTAKLKALASQSDTARRLQTMPGVGPMTAVAVEAFGPDMAQFKTGRDFAAWLGLVPRQHSSGGKERLGRMTKAGQADIRRLLIMGAMSRLGWLGRPKIAQGSWLSRMLARKPTMLVAIALANKMARQIWAMLRKNEDYKDPALAVAA